MKNSKYYSIGGIVGIVVSLLPLLGFFTNIMNSIIDFQLFFPRKLADLLFVDYSIGSFIVIITSNIIIWCMLGILISHIFVIYMEKIKK